MARTGRPTSKWDPRYVAQAYRLAMLGLTDVQIAAAFDVSERQLNNWKKKYPELLQSLNNGKLPADGNVTLSLYQRAIGYVHDHEHIHVLRDGTVVRVATKKRYAADTTACIFWLKNRQRTLWRDVAREDEGDPVDAARELRRMLADMDTADGVTALQDTSKTGSD